MSFNTFGLVCIGISIINLFYAVINTKFINLFIALVVLIIAWASFYV